MAKKSAVQAADIGSAVDAVQTSGRDVFTAKLKPSSVLDPRVLYCVMMRENCEKGFLVSFDYFDDAPREIESFFKRSHKVIMALTVKEILDGRSAIRLV